MELPGASDAVAEAVEAQRAAAQLQAEKDAAEELRLLETRRAARDKAAASRARLRRRQIQLTAIVSNHWRRYNIRLEKRTAERGWLQPRRLCVLRLMSCSMSRRL